MIVSLGKCDIDISSVCLVREASDSVVTESMRFLSYEVQFDNGYSLNIYETNNDYPNMPREKFLELWKIARQRRIKHGN